MTHSGSDIEEQKKYKTEKYLILTNNIFDPKIIFPL